MPENITDISDKGWDDLINTDHGILRELASERDGVNGNGKAEEITAGLLAHAGRVENIPEEEREDHQEAIEAAQEAADGDESDDAGTEAAEGEEAEEEDEGAADADDEDAAKEYQRNPRETPPAEDAEFIIEGPVMDEWFDFPDALVDECKLVVDDDGWHITAVDPANVGMVDATLSPIAFESFDVGEPGRIGLPLGRVTDVVGQTNKGDLVSIKWNAETRFLEVSFGGHQFQIATIDPDSIRKEPDLPDLNLPVEVSFGEAAPLSDAIKFADSVSDHITFGSRYEEREFYVHAEGDTDDYDGSFEDGEEVAFERLDEECRSIFSLDYLKDMEKAWDNSLGLTIVHGQEFPLQLETVVQAGEDDTRVGTVTYMLAPRIQSD